MNRHTTNPQKILGIETSCDETAISVVECDGFKQKKIISNFVYSQLDEHEKYGGVVPELAARAHIEKLPILIKDIGSQLKDVNAIAATAGPGLIGGLHIGYSFGRALALSLKIPFYPVHHLEAHALTVRLTDDVDFPFLLLLVSGGHTQIINVKKFRNYTLLGQTRDDSCGELFDKTAKLLNLGFPGGPAIEKEASPGNPYKYALPCPFYKQSHCDFSFSGLKTAVRLLVENEKNLVIPDLCASLQYTVAKVLIDRLKQAIVLTQPKQLVIAGGVAANQYIREQVQFFCKQNNITLIVPPAQLCTDNAAMVAWVGCELLLRGISPDDILPRPRWSLEELRITESFND